MERAEVNSTLQAIGRRRQLAALSDAYEKAANTIDVGTDPAKGSTHAQAKKTLFTLIHPQFGGVTDVASNSATSPAFKMFNRVLKVGHRWSRISKRLGAGVLALIPESLIARKFVEVDLRNHEFEVWVDLIEHVNPGCVRLGQVFGHQINGALYGLMAPKKRLRLETIPRADIRDNQDMSLLLEEVNEGQLTSGDEANNSLVGYQLCDV